MRPLYDSTKTDDSTPKTSTLNTRTQRPYGPPSSTMIGMARNLRSACRNRWSASSEYAVRQPYSFCSYCEWRFLDTLP